MTVDLEHKEFRLHTSLIDVTHYFGMLGEKKVTQVGTLKGWISNHKFVIFPLLAFIIPLVVRTIPEILMGPYIVGFDTLAFYIPNTLTWLHNGINLWGFLSTAPLFYLIYMGAVAIGGSPVFVLKIISPVLLGFLSLSIFSYAKKGLNWSSIKSTFVAILGAVYFVGLRASWDQLREEVGLVFFFVVLMLICNRKNNSWANYVILSVAMLSTALSHQLVSVLMLGVIVSTVAYNLLRKDFKHSIKLIVTSLPAVLYFFAVYIGGVLQAGMLDYSTNVGSPLANWTGFTSYTSMLLSTGGFFLYCYLLILPVAVIGIWQLRNIQLTSWLFFSVILVLLPFASVSPFRWVLILTYPLAFYVTSALSRLKTIRWKSYKFPLRKIVILYLVLSTGVLSISYISSTPEHPFLYFNPLRFNSYAYQIPSSMLQNTISISDCQDTIIALQWFRDNVDGSSILLTHTVFCGWAFLVLNESQIMNYEFNSPNYAATVAAKEGYSQLYLIWWTNGQGWYSQPTLPPAFSEIFNSEKIAIYSYNATFATPQ